VRITGLDHIVLVVADTETSLHWYTQELGLEPLRVDEWRRGEVPFASVRVDDTTIIDLLEGRASGQNLDHLALVVDEVDLDELATSGRFDVVTGPVGRWGARGEGRSVYVRDPDGHVVELRTYPAPQDG
jgi:catechol 2,3-dioxygenase-like lactoylglutathione lyase family enzyme